MDDRSDEEEAVHGSPEQKSNGLTAGKLINRFVKNKAEVLRFMTDFTVPFDNTITVPSGIIAIEHALNGKPIALTS